MALAPSRAIEDETLAEPKPLRPAPPIQYTQVQSAADALIAAVEREDNTDARRLLDVLVALVPRYFNQRPEASRGFFLSTLGLLLARINRKAPMPPGAREELTEELVQEIETAATVADLVQAFSNAFDWLSAIAKAVEGPKILRLETALNHVRRNFTGRLRLWEVARKSGFSVPAFVKIFKERTGTSFLPFVRSLRIEHAKSLLMTTDMTVHAVALASGFQSPITMTRSFRTVTGRVPTSFRAPAVRRVARAATALRRSSSSS